METQTILGLSFQGAKKDNAYYHSPITAAVTSYPGGSI